MADRNRRFRVAAIALPLLLVAMPGFSRATPFTVNTTADTGAGSLRAAITSANAAPTVPNTINFNVSGTITLGSSLPAIANTSPGSLTIDGSGQSITVDGANSFQILSVNSGAALNLRNLTIAHGNEQSIPEGEDGGGVENKGTLTVTNCTFSDNAAGLGGGAIANVGTLTVTTSTFTGNNASSAGGIDNFGTLTVTDSTFSNNIANNGGGILNGATVTLTNCTFSGNIAAIGGGLENVGSTLLVTNCTFSGNSGGGSGGGIFTKSGVTKLKSTILADEPSGGNCTGANTPPVVDAGFNISDDNSCGFSGTSIDSSTALHLDPAGLADNGGPTKTIALEPNSQAIDFIPVPQCTDQSSPTPKRLTTDQRGFARPDSSDSTAAEPACDAGAFESGPADLVIENAKVQVVKSAVNADNQLNINTTFINNGIDNMGCAGDDALHDGLFIQVLDGTCASGGGPLVALFPFAVHTVNGQSYGTFFGVSSILGETYSARLVALPKPAGACGEWTLNFEGTGADLTNAFNLGDSVALTIFDTDGDPSCFDVPAADTIIGSQIPTPKHGARRRVRR